MQVATAEGPPPQETQVRIDTVAIEDGSLNFADFWIQPNYAVSIQQLNGSITGLSSEETSRAKLDLEGKVDRYAPATIDGEMNLLSATLYTEHPPQVRRRRHDLGHAVLRPLCGLQDREGQALGRRDLQGREPRARRQAEVRDRPAPARRQGGEPRRREPAAQARGRAAEGPQRRHRHRPADDRQPRRPEVPPRAAHLEGVRRPPHQDRDRAVRAHRQPVRRRARGQLRGIRAGRGPARPGRAGEDGRRPARRSSSGPRSRWTCRWRTRPSSTAT